MLAKEGLEATIHEFAPGRGSLIARLTLEGDRIVAEERLLTDLGHRFRDIRQGADGLIYLLTDAKDGALLRLRPA